MSRSPPDSSAPLLPPVGQGPAQSARLPDSSPPENMAGLEFKARLLLLFMLLLVCGSAMYVLYARGVFESTQRLVLMAEDSEGVVVGMDMTFAGFPIGRVRRIELAEDGKARILVDVAEKDAHWLRSSSVFTLVKGIVGGPNIRAYTGLLNDPPLPKDAVRTVLQGDASAEIPRVIASAKELIDNLNSLTGSNGSVGASLANLQVLTERLNGPGGALTVLLGRGRCQKVFRHAGPHQCIAGQTRRHCGQDRYPGVWRQRRAARGPRHGGATQCHVGRGAHQPSKGRCHFGQCPGNHVEC